MKTILALMAALLLLAGCAGEKSGSNYTNKSAPVKGGDGQIVDVGGSIPAGSSQPPSGTGGKEYAYNESGDSITLNDTTPSQGEVSSGGSVGFGK